MDFGAGPRLLDERSGEWRKSWVFVMTLCHSRHQYAEIIWRQDVSSWLECHRHAFEWFGALPRRLIIDNAKCAITRACYRITSNLDFTEWGEAFPNRLLGAATLDRLRHGAYRLILDGNSYRSPRPLPGEPKTTLAKHPKYTKS